MNKVFKDLNPEKPIQWSEKEIDAELKLFNKSEKRRKKFLRRALHKSRDDEIKKEYEELIPKKKPKKGFDLSTTTKQLMLFIVINCSIIEIYAMVVMVKFMDLSALDALISAVVAESFSFMVYCTKSYLENRSQKSHEYDMEKLRVENVDTETQQDPEDRVFTEDETLISNSYTSGTVTPITNECSDITNVSTDNQ